MKELKLGKFTYEQAEHIWTIAYSQDEPEWSKWNGPYFEEYIKYATLNEFKSSSDWQFLLRDSVRCIFIGDEPVGMLSKGWIDKKTRWMEIGIVIYDPQYWNSGYGTKALTLWTSETFSEHPEIQHLGMTTWSGNMRMMRAAEKLGYKKEAQIRAVRYWQGVYYDSVKYGVLRSEWEAMMRS